MLPVDLATCKRVDVPQLFERSAGVEHSSRNEEVRHVDGIRDGPQENQRSQSEDRTGGSRFKRKDQHDQSEYIGRCDRKESGAGRAYDRENQSECAAFSDSPGQPPFELAVPSSIDAPRHAPGGKSVDAPDDAPVVFRSHVVLAQCRDQYRTPNNGDEQSDPSMLAKPD